MLMANDVRDTILQSAVSPHSNSLTCACHRSIVTYHLSPVTYILLPHSLHNPPIESNYLPHSSVISSHPMLYYHGILKKCKQILRCVTRHLLSTFPPPGCASHAFPMSHLSNICDQMLFTSHYNPVVTLAMVLNTWGWGRGRSIMSLVSK